MSPATTKPTIPATRRVSDGRFNIKPKCEGPGRPRKNQTAASARRSVNSTVNMGRRKKKKISEHNPAPTGHANVHSVRRESVWGHKKEAARHPRTRQTKTDA